MGAGHLQEGEVEFHLLEAALGNTDDPKGAKQTILDGLKHGIASPLSPPQKPQSDNSQQAVVNRSQTPNSESELYLFSEDGTARWKETHNGRILIPVANFTAQIVEELEFDDGEESSLHYKIQGELRGHSLPEVQVPARQFDSLCFVAEKYGSQAQISPPSTNREYLRHAIQVNSGEVARTKMFTHTGLRVVDGKNVYLTSTGALDQEEIKVQLDGGQNLKLQRYSLPLKSSPSEIKAGIEASLNFLKAAHSKVSIPLWMAPFAAVLMSLLEEPFASLFILGPSGSHKTTLAVLAQCHLGNFSTNNLHSFNDTANSLEKAALILKDAPMLVNDKVHFTPPKTNLKFIISFSDFCGTLFFSFSSADLITDCGCITNSAKADQFS